MIQCESEGRAPANRTSREPLITVAPTEQDGVFLSVCLSANVPVPTVPAVCVVYSVLSVVLVNRCAGPSVSIAAEQSAGRQGRESGQRQNFFSEQLPVVAYRPSFYLVCAEHYPSVVRGLSMN